MKSSNLLRAVVGMFCGEMITTEGDEMGWGWVQ